jgi:hypothetical protein
MQQQLSVYHGSGQEKGGNSDGEEVNVDYNELQSLGANSLPRLQLIPLGLIQHYFVVVVDDVVGLVKFKKTHTHTFYNAFLTHQSPHMFILILYII